MSGNFLEVSITIGTKSQMIVVNIPSFFDLVSLLDEPVPDFLRDLGRFTPSFAIGQGDLRFPSAVTFSWRQIDPSPLDRLFHHAMLVVE